MRYQSGGWFDYVEAIAKGAANGISDQAKKSDAKKDDKGGAVTSAASAVKDALTSPVEKAAKAAAKKGSLEVFIWIAIGYLVWKGR